MRTLGKNTRTYLTIIALAILVLLPPHAKSAVLLSESFDSTVAPPGWTAGGWWFDPLGFRSNFTGGAGNYAMAFDQYTNSWNVNLCTPALDMTALSAASIEFKSDVYYFEMGGGYASAYVNVSVDGGPFTNVWSRENIQYRGPQTEVIDISAIAAGHNNVVTCFQHYNDYAAAWWQVDDVKISGCPDVDGDGYGNPGDALCAGGSATDCNDGDAFINPGATDVNCNAVDENCSGAADEGYTPAPTSCGTGPCGSTGATTCVNGIEGDTCTPGAPLPESCNNVDDDCDGSIDEALSRLMTCGVGSCAATGTTETCSAGVWSGGTCTPGSPLTEYCNNIDDDCDGSVDDNLSRPTTCGGVGACAGTGTETCTAGVWGGNTCTPGTSVTEGPIGDDKCSDDIDNDCDGALDEMDGGCVSTSSNDKYVFDRLWPTLQQPWYFDNPSGIAVDSNGFIYVADYFNHRIQKFDSNGMLVTKWGSQGSGDGQFIYPMGVAVDNDGFVYVAAGNRIQKFDSNGVFVTKWGSYCHIQSGEGCVDPDDGGPLETGDGQFYGPHGLAIDNSGFVYVVDAVNHRIQKFDSNGVFVTKWGSFCNMSDGSGCVDPDGAGSRQSGDGQFYNPYGIAIDNSGFVYVADSANYRIQKFSSTGTFITKWGSYGTGDGQFKGFELIAVDSSGLLYVADYNNHRIQKFDSNGVFVTKWGSLGSSDGQFLFPYGIAVSNNGLIYVTDSINKRIQKFDSNGMFITKWGSQGSGDGQFMGPTGIATVSNGYLYVVDRWNDRIQKFTSDGVLESRWGSQGSGNGQFRVPSDIAVDSSGLVYVVDTYNHRIQKFNSNGVFVTKWGSQGSEDGQFYYPNGVAISSDGFVYVVDTYNNRIQKFDLNGVFVNKWGSQGIGNGQFASPKGIAIDSGGFVYVVDTFNQRIQKFTPDGVFITKWGSRCDMSTGSGCVDSDGSGPRQSGDGQFFNPQGIDIDSSEFVYVVDTDNHRIQKFTPDGQFLSKFGKSGSGPGLFNSPSYLEILNDKIYVTDSDNNRVQVIKQVSVSSNNKAIVVAGGGPYPGNKLWEATQTAANFAYITLTYQGFPNDSIYYLSSDTGLDLDNDGISNVDGNATVANLQNAITTWASGADNLFVYLVDHGGSGNFRMSETETLSATELNSWLNTLQATMTGKVTLIYDACESGSFLPTLAGTDRILVSSTSTGQSSYFVNQGSVSFSSFFWTNVFNGSTVKEAFDDATSALTTAISNQHPQLNDGAGGTLAQNTYIGNGTIISGNIPTIGSVSASSPTQSSATLTANNVTDADGIARVWAVILPPNYASGAANNAVNGLPYIDLMPTATLDQYQATYDKFNIAGTYNIAIYAKDRIGNTSMPMTTTVTVSNPLRRKAIIVAGGSQADVNWSGIRKGVQAAYDALKFQKYSDDDIYLMSPGPVTVFQNEDAMSLRSSLSFAINTWANNSSTYDVVLYMIGNGDAGTFTINARSDISEAERTVTSADLNSWLNALQGTITGKVTVIYDASYSGAFNSTLAGPDRILIASSGGQAYFLSDGDISFSNYFWKRILNGWNVRDAFYHARSAMEFSTAQEQKAWIDDNGNGSGNESSDGTVAFNYTIGVGIRLAGKDPMIGSVSAIPDTLTGTLSTLIRADNVTTVGTLAAVNPVWAVVTAPKGPGDSEGSQTIVVLSDVGNNRYEGSTGNIFNAFGKYEVAVFAKDDAGDISSVSQTTVYQKGLIDKYEDDDIPAQANVIKLNYPDSQQHNFHDSGDWDWVMFYGIAGQIYHMDATNLGGNCDTVLELYHESDLATPVASWDNAGNGAPDEHSYTVLTDGIYYLKVRNSNPNVYGNDTGYDLDVYIPDMPTTYGVVNGTVTDTDAPQTKLGGVVIRSSRTPLTAISEPSGVNKGKYEFPLHDIGSYTLSATMSGYSGVSGIAFSVSNDNTTPLDVTMAKACSDGDTDGYGNPGSSSCLNGNALDCNDGNGNINPGVAEVCDGVDNNCNWVIDEGYDIDGDGVSDCFDSDIDGDGILNGSDNCDLSWPARVVWYGGTEYFSTMQGAYDWAEDGDEVQCQYEIIYGDVYIDDLSNKTVTFKGGYDCTYSTTTGVTTIYGNMHISKGKLIINGGKLKVQ